MKCVVCGDPCGKDGWCVTCKTAYVNRRDRMATIDKWAKREHPYRYERAATRRVVEWFRRHQVQDDL